MSTTTARTAASPTDFVISRTFDARRERVWKALTEVENMKHWFSPKGFAVKTAVMDLRPGGRYHYCLRSSEGQEMWGKAIYREIAAPERLVWVNSFSDPEGGTTRHPMAPTWPREMLTTITLAENRGRTTMVVRWSPLNPTEEERQAFDGGHESMRQGWTGTLDQLEQFLTKI
jgi:uncharacterized protein YndB with AHSA1/START domain